RRAEPADPDDERAGSRKLPVRLLARGHHQKKAPLRQNGEGLTSVRTLSFAAPSRSEEVGVGISTSVPCGTGCCGVAGPGPQPLWIRLCFIFSLEGGANPKGARVSMRAVD